MTTQTLLRLAGFGLLLGVGLIAVLTGFQWLHGRWYTSELAIGSALTIAGSVLILLAFGGAYSTLRPEPR